VFDHTDEFHWEPIPTKKEWRAPELSVTVDTPADIEYVSTVADALPDASPADWHIEEIIAACRSVEHE